MAAAPSAPIATSRTSYPWPGPHGRANTGLTARRCHGHEGGREVVDELCCVPVPNRPTDRVRRQPEAENSGGPRHNEPTVGNPTAEHRYAEAVENRHASGSCESSAQPLTALSPATLHYGSTGAVRHTVSESMTSRPAASVRLKGAFHGGLLDSCVGHPCHDGQVGSESSLNDENFTERPSQKTLARTRLRDWGSRPQRQQGKRHRSCIAPRIARSLLVP